MQGGRAAMAPAGLERRVLDPQVPLPHEAAVHVERNDVPVAEPGVDPLAVGDGRRGGEVVLFVQFRERADGLAAVLPEPRAIAPVERLDDEISGPIRRRLGTTSADRLLTVGERSVVAREPRMRAGGHRGAAHLRGDDDVVAPDDRRRRADAREPRLPGEVLAGTPCRRKVGLRRDAPARGPAPLRPVRPGTALLCACRSQHRIEGQERDGEGQRPDEEANSHLSSLTRAWHRQFLATDSRPWSSVTVSGL